MASYHIFASTRTTQPDPVALLAVVRSAANDPGCAVGGISPHFTAKKAAVWIASEIAAVQTAIDTAPALTPQRQAQNAVDAFPIECQALVLALIDQLNIIRAALPSPLPPITPAQALGAVRAKAGQL